LLFYNRLSRKPLLFKSFIGLSVKQFDNIYDEIKSKYAKHEIKRLSYRKDRKRSIGGGRHFKLDVKDRIIMVLVYYRLYIAYTLTGLLFDLDQSNICRDIQKIESLIRTCLPTPHKIYNITKRLKTPQKRLKNIFQALWLSSIQQNSRFQDQKIRGKERCNTLVRERNIR
jgi:hypothetical protein